MEMQPDNRESAQTLTAPPTPPEKKRGLFQLHLSTCIVVMLVASVLLGANVLPDVCHGWQFRYGGISGRSALYYGCPWSFYDDFRRTFYPATLLLDLLVTSLALVATAIGFEYSVVQARSFRASTYLLITLVSVALMPVPLSLAIGNMEVWSEYGSTFIFGFSLIVSFGLYLLCVLTIGVAYEWTRTKLDEEQR